MSSIQQDDQSASGTLSQKVADPLETKEPVKEAKRGKNSTVGPALLISILANIICAILFFGWSTFSSELSFFRKLYLPMEHYSGRYVQIITPIPPSANTSNTASMEYGRKNNDYYYSILDVHYDKISGAYVLTGHQYTKDGIQTTSFSSDTVNVFFSNFTYLKFIWKTHDISDPTPDIEERKVDGYTEMMFADETDKFPVGIGFFIGFHVQSTKTKFLFFKLTPELIKVLNIKNTEETGVQSLSSVPTTDFENTKFIQALEKVRNDSNNYYFFRNIGLSPIL